MYRTTLLVVGLFLSLATVGCKSDIEKYADDVCACKDKKCLDEVSAKYKDKFPKDDKKKLEDMPAKDKEAFGRALECSLKIAFEK